MSLGIPAHLAPAIFAKALSRLFLVYAATCLMLSELLLLIAAANEKSWAIFWTAVVTGLPGLLLLRAVGKPPSRPRALSYLMLMSAVLAYVAYAMLSPGEFTFNTAFTPLAFMSFALVMVCGAATTIVERMVWLMLGYGASQLVLFKVAEVTGKEFAFDWRVLAGTVIAGIAIVVTPQLLAKSTRVQASIDLTTEVAQEEVFRSEATRDATMAVHDTLLATLSALGLAKPGPLSQPMMRNVEHQLASLHSTNWVAQAVIPEPDLAFSPWSEALLDVVATAESSGLQVNVSGQSDVFDRLGVGEAEALLAALAQCLTNVLKHSGQTSAEVVILATDDAVTVTIIDTGVGFNADAVPPDRLGLRMSVNGRLEAVGGSVNLWTGSGMGTAVMLKVPMRVPGVTSYE